jgi:hypothetical protein
LDNYVRSEVLLPHGDLISTGQAVGRKWDLAGTGVRGKANRNPILDIRTYCVEFPDRAEAEYSLNTITENACELSTIWRGINIY